MLPFSYFLLKVIICSAVLFSYYWFFLRNKIFHAYNRFYLLSIILLSVGLPAIKLNIFHEAANKTTVIKMLQVVTAGEEYMDEIIIGAPTKSHFSFVDFFPFLYYKQHEDINLTRDLLLFAQGKNDKLSNDEEEYW